MADRAWQVGIIIQVKRGLISSPRSMKPIEIPAGVYVIGRAWDACEDAPDDRELYTLTSLEELTSQKAWELSHTSVRTGKRTSNVQHEYRAGDLVATHGSEPYCTLWACEVDRLFECGLAAAR